MTVAYCAGDIDHPCPPRWFCDYAPGAACGGTDAPGVCHPVPESCPAVSQSNVVCGCDGMTYSDACFASLAGTGVMHAGRCVPPDCRTTGCAAGSYCAACRSANGRVYICLVDGAAC